MARLPGGGMVSDAADPRRLKATVPSSVAGAAHQAVTPGVSPAWVKCDVLAWAHSGNAADHGWKKVPSTPLMANVQSMRRMLRWSMEAV